jgi:hypothetical protein
MNAVKRPADTEHDPPFKKLRFVDTPSYPATGANAIPNKENERMSGTGPQSGFRVPCPKLTDDERVILNQFSGCRKCRQLFVNHKAGNCPNGFPDGKIYRPLTRDYAQSLATRKAIAATQNSNDPQSFNTLPSSSISSVTPYPTASPVAATLPFISNNPSFDYTLPVINDPPNPHAYTHDTNNPASSSDVPGNISSIIASLPSTDMNLNFALSPDSDHGSVQSAPVSPPPNSIRPLGPVSVDHLKWKAAVYGEGDFPRTFDCLLDNRQEKPPFAYL